MHLTLVSPLKKAPSRGCHLITKDVMSAMQGELKEVKIGMMNLFIQHTSASLTINENADPDVRRDMEVALNKIVQKVFQPYAFVTLLAFFGTLL